MALHNPKQDKAIKKFLGEHKRKKLSESRKMFKIEADRRK